MRDAHLKTELKYNIKVGVVANWLIHNDQCMENIRVNVIIEMSKCITLKIKPQNFFI